MDNTSAPQYPDITVRATTGQGGVSEAGGHVFVAKTPEAFVHDDDGNVLSDGRWAYTWDGENRLVSMTTHASVPPLAQRRLVFAYDHMSRRATKHEFTRNPATGALDAPAGESAYAWDGWTLAAEFAPSTGAALRRYVWNPSARGGHRSLAAVRLGGGRGASASPPAQFAVVDANANVSLLLNGASGAASPGGGAPEMSAVYEYGPFGEPLRATGPLAKANPVRFSSELLDTATGCYYYGYRYYNPDTGRWLSRDPIGELGGVNLYAMLKNATTSRRDTFGLSDTQDSFWEEVMEGLRGCNICGEDITDALAEMLYRVESDFLSLSSERRREVCFHLVSPVKWPIGRTDVAGPTNNWDIVEIIDGALNREPLDYRRSNPRRKWVECATGDCINTVRVDGKCHSMYTVNYVLHGRLTRLCSNLGNSIVGAAEVGAWSAGKNMWEPSFDNLLPEKYAWFNAGYNGWPRLGGSTPAEPGHYRHCTNCPHKCSRLSYKLPLMPGR